MQSVSVPWHVPGVGSLVGLFSISLCLPFYWSCLYELFSPATEPNLQQAVKSDIVGARAAWQGCVQSLRALGPLLPSSFAVKALRLSALSTGIWIEWN